MFEYTATLRLRGKLLLRKWSVHATPPLNCVYNFINDIKSASSPWEKKKKHKHGTLQFWKDLKYVISAGTYCIGFYIKLFQ